MDKIQISFNLSSSYEAMSAEQTATQDDIVSAYCQMLFSLSNKLRKTLIFFQMIWTLDKILVLLGAKLFSV